MYRHWKYKIDILQEVPIPLLRCNQCGMHMPEARLWRHIHTAMGNRATDMRLQRRDMELSQISGKMDFILYSREGM